MYAGCFELLYFAKKGLRIHLLLCCDMHRKYHPIEIKSRYCSSTRSPQFNFSCSISAMCFQSQFALKRQMERFRWICICSSSANDCCLGVSLIAGYFPGKPPCYLGIMYEYALILFGLFFFWFPRKGTRKIIVALQHWWVVFLSHHFPPNPALTRKALNAVATQFFSVFTSLLKCTTLQMC